MIGTKDRYKEYYTTHLQYTNPIVINYDEGHKFPKDMTVAEFEPLMKFIIEKYNEKNSYKKE